MYTTLLKHTSHVVHRLLYDRIRFGGQIKGLPQATTIAATATRMPIMIIILLVIYDRSFDK